MNENLFIEVIIDDEMRDAILHAIGDDQEHLAPFGIYDPNTNMWKISKTIAGVQTEDLINRVRESLDQNKEMELYDDLAQRLMMCINSLAYIALSAMFAQLTHEVAVATSRKPLSNMRYKNEYGHLTRLS